jgi:predicted dehydrogenase
LSERELDEILAAAARAGREFHEMAGTVFVQPYLEMRRLVREGAVGEVIQVFVQKSYPYGTHRPQEEAIDGGMFLQVGIHAIRMVTHAAGARIRSIEGWETALGVPEEGECRIAGAAQIVLENGGLATLIMNYLNPPNNKPRGHETLRIFGTKGFIESTDGGTRTRLVTGSGVTEPLPATAPGGDYFDLIAAHLATGAPLPLTSEEELHPLRMLLRAKAGIRTVPVSTSSPRLERPKSSD